MKEFLAMFFLTLLTACNSSNSDQKEMTANKLLGHYDDTLKGEILSSSVLSKSGIVTFITPYGLVGVSSNSRGVVCLLDTLNGEVLAAQYNRGKGPDELLDPIGMGYNPLNSTFCVWDLGKQAINLYKVSAEGFEKVRTNYYNKMNPSQLRSISNTEDIILTSIPYQSLLIHNSKGIVDSLPYRIVDDADLDYFYHYNPSSIELSVKDELIFASDFYLPYLAAFTYRNKKIVKLWDKMVFKPEYVIKNRWLSYKKDSYIGFYSMSTSNRFIYLSYLGVTISAFNQDKEKLLKQISLLVFDFDGNFVKSYLLDQNLTTFTVTPDDRVLYGLIENPDFYIVKYNLK
jgi:hypothetical protein